MDSDVFYVRSQRYREENGMPYSRDVHTIARFFVCCRRINDGSGFIFGNKMRGAALTKGQPLNTWKGWATRRYVTEFLPRLAIRRTHELPFRNVAFCHCNDTFVVNSKRVRTIVATSKGVVAVSSSQVLLVTSPYQFLSKIWNCSAPIRLHLVPLGRTMF